MRKWLLPLIISASFGLAIGVALFYSQDTIKQTIWSKPNLYQANDSSSQVLVGNQKIRQLTWSSLIPENEKAILQKYQAPPPQTAMEFGDQILRSIEASSDTAYQNAMQSFNTVDGFDNQLVSIPGFIVPLEYSSDKSPSHVFIVPYFGACIHFPPPPPNQMIFARLDGTMKDFDMTQAYTIVGVMSRQLFEDELGTAAYSLRVISIQPYFDDPDDFRRH